MTRHLLSIADLTPTAVVEVFALAARLKAQQLAGECHHLLTGKSVALIFEKPSNRTRTTFDVGMFQLGGHAVSIAESIRMGERESVGEVARNLSRWIDGIVARTFSHTTVVQLAEHGTIPVVNALTDLEHPCQALTDLFTMQERFGDLRGRKLAYVGDGNNMANSLSLLGPLCGVDVTIGCPDGYRPDARVTAQAQQAAAAHGTKFVITDKPERAVVDADVVYTDVWTSMGQEAEHEQRLRVFPPYQVNAALVARAKPTAVVMHCLPAHRGWEITDEVLDGEQSVVYDEAENRLHVQKAVLVQLLAGGAVE